MVWGDDDELAMGPSVPGLKIPPMVLLASLMKVRLLLRFPVPPSAAPGSTVIGPCQPAFIEIGPVCTSIGPVKVLAALLMTTNPAPFFLIMSAAVPVIGQL